MRIKNSIIAMVISATSVSAFAMVPSANSGRVTFEGSIVDTPCNLSPGAEGEDVIVSFGQLSKSRLSTGQKPTKEFTISLVDCALDGKTADITFRSAQADTTKKYLIPTGKASGVGISIQNVTFDKSSPLTTIHDGDNLFKFQAQVAGIAKTDAGKTDVGKIIEGNFYASTDFVITYK